MAADAEMCMLAADTMEALGFKRGDYVVKVNSRKVFDGVMGASNIPNDKRLTVLRALDKLDRLGPSGVEMLLQEGRKDESGDFTKGAQLTQAQIDAFGIFLTYRPVTAIVDRLEDGSTHIEVITVVLLPNGQTERRDPNNFNTLDNIEMVLAKEPEISTGLRELREIANLVHANGYHDRVLIDPSVVRGLEYYTGPVYEIELLIETKDEKGRPVRFGSVGGGGRYDGLVSRFRGEPVPATGFSIGVSRLQAALTLIGKADSKAATGPVVVTVFDKDRIADYQAFTVTLRQAGIRAELYLGNPKHSVGQQLKYADKRKSPCAIIQGPDERDKGMVTIKDLRLGSELAGDDKDRAAHLEKQAQAQQTVKRDQLVDEVRKILER
jgi:histidyl-tRNA synthetase